ncbi:hypothetical protein GGG16DRAFT_119955 [Schizophyllum commune]
MHAVRSWASAWVCVLDLTARSSAQARHSPSGELPSPRQHTIRGASQDVLDVAGCARDGSGRQSSQSRAAMLGREC